MTQEKYLLGLVEAIKATHGLMANHLSSVPVKETFEGKTVWEGVVEVFSVSSAKAPLCYAWGYEKDGNPEVITVLGLPPVDSPQRAVQVYISSLAK